MANRNLELLIVAVKLLRPVLSELVFVGGCATGLLVSDEAPAEVRPSTHCFIGFLLRIKAGANPYLVFIAPWAEFSLSTDANPFPNTDCRG